MLPPCLASVSPFIYDSDLIAIDSVDPSLISKLDSNLIIHSYGWRPVDCSGAIHVGLYQIIIEIGARFELGSSLFNRRRLRRKLMKPEGTLILKRSDVAALLGVEECIAVVEQALRLHAEGKTSPPGVLGIHARTGGFLI
jgi:hypothetical protein